MIVNYQKPIEFINTCGCTVDYVELEKAILWYSEKPVARLRKIYLHGVYPGVSIHQEKIHVHRLLMMYWSRRRLKREEYVHHKDGIKLNAKRTNLEIMIENEHQSLHNKGKILSEKHKQGIAAAGRRRKGKIEYRLKLELPVEKIVEMYKEGRTVNYIAKHFGVDRSTIRKRLSKITHLLPKEDE